MEARDRQVEEALEKQKEQQEAMQKDIENAIKNAKKEMEEETDLMRELGFVAEDMHKEFEILNSADGLIVNNPPVLNLQEQEKPVAKKPRKKRTYKKRTTKKTQEDA